MNDAEYTELLRAKLTPNRFTHSLNVADSAVILAERFGADAGKAYTAGLLHDIMKDAPPNEQLKILRKAGIILPLGARHGEKVWHALAGAEYLRAELGVADEEILSAVRYHTTGRAEMTLLEKVVFVADYISADRTYDGVVKMRRLAERSLDDAILFGQEFTIVSLIEKGRPVHPDSINCYNEIIEGKIRNDTKRANGENRQDS